MDAENVALHAARALTILTQYKNLKMLIGMCDCHPLCTNTKVEIIRTPIPGDEDPQPGVVADGLGPEVWTALVAAHAKLEKAIADDQERRSEIAALNELYEL